MLNIIKIKNQIISILTILSLFIPHISIYAIELNSTNYIVNEYDFDTGGEMNSTNYSVTGNTVQGQKGYFSSDSLPLAPGVITSCGKITSSGTYTLGANITNISGSCFSIQSNDVIIDGNGFSIMANGGNTSYAIVATSSSVAGSAYGTTTIQNLTLFGFGGGIRSTGNNAVSGNTNGGNGGSLIISNSTIGNILTSAGLGSGTGSIGNGANIIIDNSSVDNITNAGLNGSIYITGGDLDLSDKTYTTSGTFSLEYTGNLTTTNTTLSSLQNFIIQGNNYGAFIGGEFPLFPSTINTCGNLYFAGTYTLSSDLTANCNISGNGVIINGAGNILTGNITANNYGVTLSNINVTGTVSTTGGSAGALNVLNSSNLTGNISVTGPITGDGSSSLSNTTINAGGSVATSSVSFVADVVNNGTINSGNSVIGKITNNSIINTLTSFVFNASSTNSGTVNGNAIFSASSTNSGTVNGNATFNAYTASSGIAYIYDSAVFPGTGYVIGNVYDSTGTNIINTWSFNGSSTNNGILKGNAIFNDTSKNNASGTVQGNADFNNLTQNLGSITGNANVYSPVVRPLSGAVTGQVIYYNYAGLYYNDTAPGHGVVGKWDDINNWWLDVNATSPSPIIPTAGDDVIILSGNISTTTITASVKSIIFQNNTSNNINITVNSSSLDAALFNASSTNNGTITGNATFAGTDTVNNGVVTGYITRQYSTNFYTVLTDFTHNGVHWIIQAINGATVDLTNATYSLTTNIFQALNNATFIWNNLIGTGSPNLTITSPISGTNIKWKPIISWGTSVLCQYKIDSGVYTSVNCANNGSDIPRPSAGAHTIFIKSTDSNGNTTEKTILFTYDNTQPIDTDCNSTLDESTRPYYYLTSNVNSCTVTASTTLRGDNNGGGNFYTVTGDIIGGTTNNISLQNLTVNGSVYGFKDMYISSSTINNLSLNGVFNTDNISRFGNTTATASSTIYSGTFTGNLVNNGLIVNSTTSPITVSGSITNNGTINNGFVLNASSTNTSTGIINGTTTLNGDSINQGTINGNLIFNTLTAINGVITFSSNTVFGGTGIVNGNIFDNQGSNINIWLFKDLSTNIGNIRKGYAFFNGTSTNSGTIYGDVYFDESSINSGTVQGNAYKYKSWLTAHALGGTVSGNINYYSYTNGPTFRNISGDNDWNNLSNWFIFSTTTIPLGRLPINGENITLFSSTTLKNSISNNIYIATASTTLNGSNYTLTGNILGNGAYGGQRAYDFDITNITVTGTTTAMGGDGTPSIDGGDGGNIRVTNSSTNVISVNGGDPLHNGGDAGSIYVYNTIAIQPNTPIMAIGGDSVGCGFGGSGGNVTLVDTSNYILLVNPGRSATTTVAQGGGCESIPVGSPGSSGQISVTGTYQTVSNNESDNNVNNVYSNRATTVDKKIVNIVDRIIPVVNFAIKLSDFKIKPLPVFGDGTKGTFSFGKGIKSFFSVSIPENILNVYKMSPNLLSSLGIYSMNDLFLLKNKPQLIKNTKVPGLFSVYSDTYKKPLDTYVHFDSKKYIYQSVKVDAGQNLTISLTPIIKNGNYTAEFAGKKVNFVNDTLNTSAPMTSGKYKLITNSTPIYLNVEVINNNVMMNNNSITKETFNIFQKVVNFVKKILFHK